MSDIKVMKPDLKIASYTKQDQLRTCCRKAVMDILNKINQNRNKTREKHANRATKQSFIPKIVPTFAPINRFTRIRHQYVLPFAK